MTTPSAAELEATACKICGEPMPKGEEMFNYHGYSGPCPKPPLPHPKKVILEYTQRDESDGYWLDITADGSPHNQLWFATASERNHALDDLLQMMRSVGAVDGGRA